VEFCTRLVGLSGAGRFSKTKPPGSDAEMSDRWQNVVWRRAILQNEATDCQDFKQIEK
jgi:hypothetical protein